MIGFWVLGTIIILSAIWTVTAKKPVYSVVGLLANFAALAALYLTLNAEFLAVMQIIVYSGAILVLFVFVIALLSSGVAPFAQGPNRLPKITVPAIVLAFVGLGFLAYASRARCSAARRSRFRARISAPSAMPTSSAALPISGSRSSPCSCSRLKSPR